MIEKKKELNEVLKKLGIVKNNTEQVVINCNAGNVSDWKETTRYK